MRILALTLVLTGLVASQAAAKTIDASAWRGKLIVVTDWKHHDERHSSVEDSESIANADHVMSGRVRRLLLPHRVSSRSQWLGGGGSLQQLKGSVHSTYKNVNPFGTIDITCQGKMRNNGGETLQFRTMMGFSPGVLKLVVDGLSLVPKETCNRGESKSPTFLDGWPEDWVFALPAAPQSSKKLELQSDWWRFRSGCGEGEEREGSGAPPGVVTMQDGDVLCISGSVVRVHTLLDLRRVCAHVKLTTTRSSARERCVKR
ncbi:MAG: hypothetical protein M3320_07325 [Actinomycetota bacterium]|nr:hypothetical protein [Actinomycetota bacterium]MDQ5808473.1 hypothetical protein [Actinomycetota bacterium]